MLPPPTSVRAVEEFRRTHDPAFHRIPAHLALVPPFDAHDASLVARFDAFRWRGAIDLTLGAPTPAGSALVLPPDGGAADLVALRDALFAAVPGPLAAASGTPPVLRAGLFGSAAELELGRRVLAALEPPEPFAVRSVALLVEDVRGLWHTVRERTLLPIRG